MKYLIILIILGIAFLYPTLPETEGRTIAPLHVVLEDDTIKHNSFITANGGIPVITIPKQETISFPFKVNPRTSEPLPVNFSYSIEVGMPGTRQAIVPDMKIELDPFHMVLNSDESQIMNVAITTLNYTELGLHRVILIAQEPQGEKLLNTSFDILVIDDKAIEDQNIFPRHGNPPDSFTPLQHQRNGTPFDQMQCRNDDHVLIQKYDGSPACVKPETVSTLENRNWGISYIALQNLVENSDAIITGMAVGVEDKPNGERHVWLGSYEWLKQGKYDDRQLFLEQTKQQSGNGFSVPFERGEEVLLFLKNVDVKRGAYDLVDSEKTPAKKYPIKLRESIVTFFDHGFFDENINNYDPDEDLCSERFLEDDSYYYCTTKSESYVPVEKLAETIKEKMLEKISSDYYEEHFDLKVISDQPDVVFEPGPNSGPRISPTKASGQNIEFVYTIDDVDFNYFLRTDFDNNQNQMYLQYHPPREIKSIISDEDEINKLIYSCLEKDMYKFPYKPFHVAYHIEDGLSPVIEGHGPPTIYDRWRDDPVQDREKIFRVWLATGKVDCTVVHQKFDPDNKKRQEKILLFESSQIENFSK